MWSHELNLQPNPRTGMQNSVIKLLDDKYDED